MPLITCPDCSTQVSDRAKACVKCGAPLHADTRHGDVVTTQLTGKRYKGAQLFGGGLVAFGVVFMIGDKPVTGTLLALVGLIVYLAGRMAAWWRHG